MIELNRLYNECCLTTLSKLPNHSINLVVTSPPYNMRTRIRNGKYTVREKSKSFSKKYKDFSDDMPIDVFYKFHKNVMSELLRVSQTICYNIQIVTGSKEAFFKIIGDFSKYIKDIIIWDKGSGQPAMHPMVMNSCYEMIMILESNEKAGRAIQNSNFARGEMNNIIRIGRTHNTSQLNSAVFPESLVAILIKAFSKEDDIIYDPFIGTGTTAIVAEKLNRKWIGSELVKNQYLEANKRINNSYGLFHNNRECFIYTKEQHNEQ